MGTSLSGSFDILPRLPCCRKSGQRNTDRYGVIVRFVALLNPAIGGFEFIAAAAVGDGVQGDGDPVVLRMEGHLALEGHFIARHEGLAGVRVPDVLLPRHGEGDGIGTVRTGEFHPGLENIRRGAAVVADNHARRNLNTAFGVYRGRAGRFEALHHEIGTGQSPRPAAARGRGVRPDLIAPGDAGIGCMEGGDIETALEVGKGEETTVFRRKGIRPVDLDRPVPPVIFRQVGGGKAFRQRELVPQDGHGFIAAGTAEGTRSGPGRRHVHPSARSRAVIAPDLGPEVGLGANVEMAGVDGPGADHLVGVKLAAGSGLDELGTETVVVDLSPASGGAGLALPDLHAAGSRGLGIAEHAFERVRPGIEPAAIYPKEIDVFVVRGIVEGIGHHRLPLHGGVAEVG